MPREHAEDRQFLREAQVEHRDPGAAVEISRHDLAAVFPEAFLVDVGFHVGGNCAAAALAALKIAFRGATRHDAEPLRRQAPWKLTSPSGTQDR